MQIDQKLYLQIGIACFIIIGISSLLQWIVTYNAMTIFSRISSMVFVVFYFITALFFRYMLNSLFPKPDPKEDAETEQIIKTALENMEKNDKK